MLVGLSFHGLDTFGLSLLQTAGTTADRNGKERKLHLFLLFRGYKNEMPNGKIASF